MNSKKEAWENSYSKGDNFVFYPHEEIIRFFAKFVRKKTGLNTYLDRLPIPASSINVLDIGCGIGTHLLYCHENGFTPFGFDLSEHAITFAKERMTALGFTDLLNNIRQASVHAIPWEDNMFTVALSRGVLDSMSFEIARAAIPEISRVLKKDGLFYCDLVSGDDSEHFREFSGEEVVTHELEQGTIQSYFNFEKCKMLFSDYFTILDFQLIKKINLMGKGVTSRNHLVLRNNK